MPIPFARGAAAVWGRPPLGYAPSLPFPAFTGFRWGSGDTLLNPSTAHPFWADAISINGVK